MPALPNSPNTAYDLLAYEPFVRAIARSLLADESRVGDVVQETWVRALTNPPERIGSLRAWLGRVVRHLALDQYRRDASRYSREQGVARSESVDPDEQNLELHGKVVQAVLELPEIYKSVVMLHYYRGMTLVATARELGRNTATVRSQLHRAHEQLKEKLDQGFDGDRKAWMAMIAPLAARRPSLAAVPILVKAGVSLLMVGGVAGALQWGPVNGNPPPEDGPLVVAGATDATEADSVEQSGAAGLADKAKAKQSERQPVIPMRAVLISYKDVPVEGASVWCLTASDVDEAVVKRKPGLQADAQRLFPMFGTLSKSGPDGYAKIRKVEEDFALLAISEDRLKLLRFDQTRTDQLEAKLELVASVAVLAVDFEGKPLPSIPIVLDVSVQEYQGEQLRISFMNARTHLTGENGESAQFSGFDSTMHGEGQRTWRVRLGIPGVPDEQTSFELFRDNKDPITLRVGPLGSLLVRVLDRSGAPLLMDGSVRVQSTGLHSGSESLPLENGMARFPRVGAGSRLRLVVTIPELGATWRSEIMGPAVAGETGTAVVSQPDTPALKGLVLDTDGKPLANSRLEFTLIGDEQMTLMSTPVQTNSEGIFRAELALPWPARSARVHLFRYMPKGIQWRAQSALFDPVNAPSDLGVLQLSDAKGWVAGVCIAPDGSPVQGIYLMAQGLPGFPAAVGISDSKGRFQLGGVLPHEPRIWIEDGGGWLLSSEPIAQLGQEDVRIHVVRGGSIEGTVLAESHVDRGQIGLRLYAEEPADGTTTSPVAQTDCAGDTGRFQIGGLLSGSYALEFSLHGQPVHRIDHVRVQTGQVVADSRTRQVDLRAMISSIGLRVLDGNGKPIGSSDCSARLLAKGKLMAKSHFGERGEVKLAFAKTSSGLLVLEARGYRAAVIDLEDAAGVVVLQAGIPVELKTAQRPELRTGQSLFQFSLHRTEEDPRLKGFEQVVKLPNSVARSGRATVSFPSPGQYQLFYSTHHFKARHGGTQFSPPRPVPGVGMIEVPDSTSMIELELTLPSKLSD